MRDTTPFSPKSILAILSALPAFLKLGQQPAIAGDARYSIVLERLMEVLPPTRVYVVAFHRR
jgi:hypothetical protein